MIYCYTPSVRRLILGIIFPVFLLLLSSSASFGQDANQEINALLVQRESLIQSSESTLAVDRQLLSLGYHPKAQVTVTGNTITFPLFSPEGIIKPITPMESRIKSVNPTLLSLTLNEIDQSITAVFSQAPSSLNINDIIIHFGFVGYETH